MIGVLDYGMGNLRSVCNAVYEVGHDWVLCDGVKDLETLGDDFGAGSISSQNS